MLTDVLVRDPLAVLRACLAFTSASPVSARSFSSRRASSAHPSSTHQPLPREQDTLQHLVSAFAFIVAAASSCSYLPFAPGDCCSSVCQTPASELPPVSTLLFSRRSSRVINRIECGRHLVHSSLLPPPTDCSRSPPLLFVPCLTEPPWQTATTNPPALIGQHDRLSLPRTLASGASDIVSMTGSSHST